MDFLATVRRDAIVASLAGFPFLAVFSVVWTASGVLSFVVPSSIAPWVYIVLGLPAMPLAIALERRMGYVRATSSEVLGPLTLQILFVQIVAFPAVMLVWSAAPAYVPVAFAGVVGAHFLPFQWIYQTRLYGILGVVVAVGPYLLAAVIGTRALHYTGFLVGASLAVGAYFARAHARSTWLASRDPA
jgi:hypothetical protein